MIKSKRKTQYGKEVSEIWDSLICWDRRKKEYGDFFSNILSKRNARTVLDMAAGTGFDSIVLLKAGFQVVSLDGSQQMIEIAKRNATKHGVSLSPIVADWRELDQKFEMNFDAVVCLGNSFCHLNSEERENTLIQISNLLTPNGTVIMDYRNYDRICERCPPEADSGGYYFGEGITISCKQNKGEITHTYKKGKEEMFSLTFNIVPLKTAISETESAGFSVSIYSDFRRGYNPNAAFYQLVGFAS